MATARKVGIGLRPLGFKVTKCLNKGAYLHVADNSGAKIVQIIGVKKYGGTASRLPKAGVGDVIIGTVKQGNPDMKHKVVPCVIVRQRKEFKRANGERVQFEDNACVVLKDLDKYEPKGTIIKGPVPKEVAKRYPNLGKVASVIV